MAAEVIRESRGWSSEKGEMNDQAALEARVAALEQGAGAVDTRIAQLQSKVAALALEPAVEKLVLSFEGERELVTEARAHELVRAYASAETQTPPPAFTHITLRNKSFTLEAARVVAALFSRLEARGALATLTSVDFADMIAGRPEDEALQVLATLCDSLQRFKTLTRIDLSDNALGEKGVRACFGLLQAQTELRHVYFCNNGISAAAARVIAQEVLLFRGAHARTKLETFHFYNNMSGDGGAEALAALLPLSPSLRDLRFSATRAQRAGSLAFATALGQLRALERLDLSDNTFKAEGARAIAAAVRHLPALEELNLRDAAIEDAGMTDIAAALREGGAASKLTTLDVSGNDLTAQSARPLAQTLAQCATLRVLRLEENELRSKGAKLLAGALRSGAPELHTLVANVNELGASGALALAQAVVDKPALESLELDGNFISARGVEELKSLLKSKKKDKVLGSLEDNDEDEDEVDDEDEVEEQVEEEKSFRFRDTQREVVDAARARALLLAEGVDASERSPLRYSAVSLRGKSYTEAGAQVLAAGFLGRLTAGALQTVDLADVIAGRPEDEALRVLAAMSRALRGHVLDEIDLSDNALGEKGVRACLDLLVPQPALRRLLFCNNGISAAAAAVIAQEIVLQNGPAAASTLEEFHFYNNMSGHDGCVAVADVLGQCPRLSTLRYASARAGPEASERMARSVKTHLSGLRSLDLSDCSFEEQGARQLAQAVGKQSGLEVLKLRDASLGAQGATQVAQALADARIQLLELDLSGNELLDEGVAAVAPLLATQTRLCVLRLDENEITSAGLLQLVAALRGEETLPALQELSLVGNEITARGAVAVAETFVPSKPQLARLELDTNMISDKGVARVQAALAQQGKAAVLGSLDDNDGDEESDDE